MKTIGFILGCTALLCLFELGYGKNLKCYVCNSYYQQDCADHFDNRTIDMTDCPPEADKCRKQVQEVKIDGKWDVRYIRQCASLGEVGKYDGRECKERTGTYQVKVRYCYCDNQDGCNAASSLYSLMAFVLPVIVCILFRLVK